MEGKLTKQDIEKFVRIEKFLNSITTPFNGNCYILLRVKDNKINVEGAASTLDTLSFMLNSKPVKPDYLG